MHSTLHSTQAFIVLMSLVWGPRGPKKDCHSSMNGPTFKFPGINQRLCLHLSKEVDRRSANLKSSFLSGCSLIGK